MMLTAESMPSAPNAVAAANGENPASMKNATSCTMTENIAMAVHRNTCARQFSGANVATIYGTIYSCNALGAAFGSWMGGLLHDFTGGYRAGIAVALAFVALALAPFWSIAGLRNFR